jgi:hypothetical protein
LCLLCLFAAILSPLSHLCAFAALREILLSVSVALRFSIRL